MKNIHFTADHHFGHWNIVRHCNRPWTSIEEHDSTLIELWNSVVNKKDLVYALGDLMMVPKQEDGTPRMKIYRRIRNRLNGKIILIKGNHDAGSKEYYDCFTEVCDYKEIKYNKTKIICSHYPFASWNGSFHGHNPMFHGHCHGRMDNSNYLRLDVGVDCWNYKPVHIDILLEHINKKRELLKGKFTNT